MENMGWMCVLSILYVGWLLGCCVILFQGFIYSFLFIFYTGKACFLKITRKKESDLLFKQKSKFFYDPILQEEKCKEWTKQLRKEQRRAVWGTLCGFLLIVSLNVKQWVIFQQTYITASFEDSWILIIGSIWSNHEGSLYLWLIISSLVFYWGLKPTQFLLEKTKSPFFVLSLYTFIWQIIASITGYALLVSQPLYPLALLGKDSVDWIIGLHISVTLIDPLLTIHPPLLFIGFVLVGLCWFYTLSSILALQLHYFNADLSWFSTFWLPRFYSIWVVTWCFWTLGLFLGAWWAYAELGWGGFWFWDPVENIGIIPWIILTGCIHRVSLSLHSKNPLLFLKQKILLFLGCFLYPTVLFCTWGVRSGILTSVHAFAEEPYRSWFLLILLLFFLILSFFLFLLVCWPSTSLISSLSSQQASLTNKKLFLNTQLQQDKTTPIK
jgi:cytochrome c biogenesis factor